MSKVAGEVTARSFQARTGADVYGLRINNVIEPDEYREMFPPFLVDPSLRRRNLFAYIDVRDLGQLVQHCLEVDGLGYEVFNVANADLSVAATTQELQHRFYDGVEVRREMGRDETFYAIDKARDLLGFTPRHSWRQVLTDPGARTG
jgi:nucleoside-diphosphate-sugar epimerase